TSTPPRTAPAWTRSRPPWPTRAGGVAGSTGGRSGRRRAGSTGGPTGERAAVAWRRGGEGASCLGDDDDPGHRDVLRRDGGGGRRRRPHRAVVGRLEPGRPPRPLRRGGPRDREPGPRRPADPGRG